MTMDEQPDTDTAEPARGRRPGRQGSAALIGVLTLLLGFAIAVQVRAHSSGDALAGLREDDLIGILDNQNSRAERLRQQVADLQQNLRELQDRGDRPRRHGDGDRSGRPAHR